MKKIYNKLVRDKFIDIYKHDVEHRISMSDYAVRYVDTKETLELLKEKLKEEVQELLEAEQSGDKAALQEEIADVLEVIDALVHHEQLSMEAVIEIKNKKKEKRGGFETGLFLESVDYLDKE
jgi:predicted house-cleaning noncanonical NTP pyrophosphatase (MazG superfamily)